MLTREENEILGKVEPGTPMGELLRRYWHPVAAVAELHVNPTKAIRLLGEDLVLYQDKNGSYGLLDLHCAHRRSDLSYGWVEAHGIRCNYHGWLFDQTGQCIDQPYEERAHPTKRFKDKVKTKAYQVGAVGGLIWAYLGPLPVPELWDWHRFHDRGYKQIVFSTIPCNWLQCQENSIDPVHFEWMHANWSLRQAGKDETSPTHVKVGFEEFEFGFTYHRIREDTDENDELWTVGRVCLWPNALYTGHFEWRVPIDDDHTLSVGWFIDEMPGDRSFEQETIPYWYAPIKNEETGGWITSHIMNQDYVSWIGQGTMTDRWNEHLAESDRGVIMLRKRLMQDLKIIQDGADPKAIVRDPSRNRQHLPLPKVSTLRRPIPSKPHAFPFLAGQPTEIWDDMVAAWDRIQRPTA